MYVSLLQGDHHKEHKSRFEHLNLYYENDMLMSVLIIGNEIFLLSTYLLAFQKTLKFSALGLIVLKGFMVVGFVIFMVKKYMSVIQLISAS